MKLRIDNPTPEMIRAAREAAGLSQTEAATLVGLNRYQTWAAAERGVQAIDNIRWQWFLAETGQHPTKRWETA
jgi:DNA-binding XRE family transcriptional regulator